METVMQTSFMTQWILPMALFVIMLGVGMTLRADDFRRVLRAPGAVLTGLLAQLLLLPCLGLLLVSLLQLPPLLAVGLMVLTFAPGGATSNMLTLLSRGDTALSVSLTAITSLITPFSLPLLTLLALNHWQGELVLPEFPVLESVLKLLLITLVPVLLGMLLSARSPNFSRRVTRPVKLLSLLFMILVVSGIVMANWTRLPALIAIVGPAALLLALLAMSSGYLLARLMRLQSEQQVTLSIEVGIQNAGTALLVTGGLLQSAEMSASALIYGVLMQVPALMLVLWRNRDLLPVLQRVR
jgi:BASS family bile acid:Na+ symporter